MSYATAVSGHSQRHHAGGLAKSSVKPQRQKMTEKPPVVVRKVYRRRDRAGVEEQSPCRPPEMTAQDESREPVLAAEEQSPERLQEEEVPHADTVVREAPEDSAEAPSSMIPSVVQLSFATGPVEVGETPMIIPPGFIRVVSPPSHFSSESDVPLSQWLPSHFFSLGPWRSPIGKLRDGPLQIQLMFLQFSSRGGAILQGSASSPMFRVMFETRHDREWDLVTVYDRFFEQVSLLAENYIGILANSLLSH
ncbi:hypothetical protein GOP47_0004691 [Adiantum capillus-veneris]|uniref:Uncharacterized protein n=1 Tax=Adiantum capillus-veneris TaxID=13818 RepID=A0A9D4V8C3_ADICA|nr:hypothetical protein GOP47_0004691 [Adiantum capillus-veneris]